MSGLDLILPQRINEPGWVTGGRYDGLTKGGVTTTVAMAANMLYAVPCFPVAKSRVLGAVVPLDRIGLEITAAATAGKKIRLGYYADDPATGQPGVLLLDVGELAADGIAYVEATIVGSVHCGDVIFRAVIGDGTPTVRSETTAGSKAGANAGTDATLRSGWASSLTYTAGVTTLPATFPASPTAVAIHPRILLRAA